MLIYENNIEWITVLDWFNKQQQHQQQKKTVRKFVEFHFVALFPKKNDFRWKRISFFVIDASDRISFSKKIELQRFTMFCSVFGCVVGVLCVFSTATAEKCRYAMFIIFFVFEHSIDSCSHWHAKNARKLC